PVKHTVLSMPKRKSKHVSEQCARATRRAINAGFDGVEISAAQRLLIQTFLSQFSNQREEEHGSQSLDTSRTLGVEVDREVQKVIEEEAPSDFILGFRGTPEETRGDAVGYSVEDFLYFVDRLTEVADIQYIASASWGKNIFKQTIR